MTTAKMVELLSREFRDVPINVFITLINEIQKIIAATIPLECFKVKNYEITTSEGVKEYTLTGITDVVKVYLNSIDEDGIEFDLYKKDPIFLVFKDYPPTPSVKAVVYRYPSEITSVNSQIELPQQYHLPYLYDAVCGWLEKMRSGRSDRWEYVYNVQLSKLRSGVYRYKPIENEYRF